MTKKLLQDVVKKQNTMHPKKEIHSFDSKGSEIHKIKNHSSEKEKIKREEDRLKEIDFLYARRNQGFINDPNKKSSNFSMWIVAFFAVIFLFFSISFVFSSVKITVNPKSQNLFLDKQIKALKNSNNENLSFELVSIEDSLSVSLEGKEEKDVLIEARGKVVVYNNFSTASQPLLIDTRLESPDGKIYKTDKRVVVPGMKDGKPGSVEVGIYASEPGEEYNSTPLDFKIFGFKGTSKYDKFYARSVGNIEGGMKGRVLQVSDEEKNKSIENLRGELEKSLFKKAIDTIPSGFVLFPGSSFYDIQKEDYSIDGNKMKVSVKGSFYGIVFNEKKITDFILKNTEFENKNVFISNLRELNFSFISDINWSLLGEDISSLSQLDFSVSGDLKVVYNLDTKKFTEDLLGKKKKDFNFVLTNHEAVSSANVSFKPAWKRTFPEKSKDIKIEINYP
jgi:hypothetical protein